MVDDFQIVDETISTEQLDQLVKEMAHLKADYEAKKKESTDAHFKYQEARAVLIKTLEAAGKTKYHVDNVGTVSLQTKLKVQTPKTPEDKKSLFNWIRGKYGEEGFLSYAGVNYNTLQGLYNNEFEAAELEGMADEFHIPGLSQPEHEVGLSFRK